jgi:hypothetical protein
MTFVGLHSIPTNQYGNIDEQVELVARQLKGLPGILKFRSAIEEMHRGIFKHLVYVDPDSKKDLHATFVRSEYT